MIVNSPGYKKQMATKNSANYLFDMQTIMNKVKIYSQIFRIISEEATLVTDLIPQLSYHLGQWQQQLYYLNHCVKYPSGKAIDTAIANMLANDAFVQSNESVFEVLFGPEDIECLLIDKLFSYRNREKMMTESLQRKKRHNHQAYVRQKFVNPAQKAKKIPLIECHTSG